MAADPAGGCVEACPGCAHRRLKAAASEAQKRHWLERRLAPWRERIAPLQAVAAAAREGYRDRVTLAACWDGQWRCGLRRGDEVIAIPHCPVHSPRMNRALALLLPRLPPAARFPLVYVVCSAAQLVLVVKSAAPPASDWLDGGLAAALEAAGVEGLWLHLHPAAGRRIFAKRGWRLLAGRARSRDADGLLYGPAAFAQLLPALHRRALDEAQRFLRPGAGDYVADLYCGNGGSLRRWLAAGSAAVGVESGGEAAACALLNAPGAAVLRGSCATRLPQLRAWASGSGEGARLLYANPPRTGLEPEVTAWIGGEFRPRRIACLSCSAGTLSRDLAALERAGYRVERITPYDFFPHTHHVETLALLRRA